MNDSVDQCKQPILHNSESEVKNRRPRKSAIGIYKENKTVKERKESTLHDSESEVQHRRPRKSAIGIYKENEAVKERKESTLHDSESEVQNRRRRKSGVGIYKGNETVKEQKQSTLHDSKLKSLDKCMTENGSFKRSDSITSRISTNSDRDMREQAMRELELLRTFSLREVKSKPRRNRRNALHNVEVDQLVSHDSTSSNCSPYKKTRKRIATVLVTDTGILELFQIPLNYPMYVRLKECFIQETVLNIKTSFVATVWLKYKRKKIVDLNQIYDADISFSEARYDVSQGQKQLILAHTWDGCTDSISINKRNITFSGNFRSPDIGRIDYLEFELVLHPIKQVIDDTLLQNSKIKVTVMHLGGEDDDDEEDMQRCSDMIGTFIVRNNRGKMNQREFLWEAFVVKRAENDLNETLHMCKV